MGLVGLDYPFRSYCQGIRFLVFKKRFWGFLTVKIHYVFFPLENRFLDIFWRIYTQLITLIFLLFFLFFKQLSLFSYIFLKFRPFLPNDCIISQFFLQKYVTLLDQKLPEKSVFLFFFEKIFIFVCTQVWKNLNVCMQTCLCSYENV